MIARAPPIVRSILALCFVAVCFLASPISAEDWDCEKLVCDYETLTYDSCTLRCSGTLSCDNTKLICQDGATCNVQCEGILSCPAMNLMALGDANIMGNCTGLGSCGFATIHTLPGSDATISITTSGSFAGGSYRNTNYTPNMCANTSSCYFGCEGSLCYDYSSISEGAKVSTELLVEGMASLRRQGIRADNLYWRPDGGLYLLFLEHEFNESDATLPGALKQAMTDIYFDTIVTPNVTRVHKYIMRAHFGEVYYGEFLDYYVLSELAEFNPNSAGFNLTYIGNEISKTRFTVKLNLEGENIFGGQPGSSVPQFMLESIFGKVRTDFETAILSLINYPNLYTGNSPEDCTSIAVSLNDTFTLRFDFDILTTNDCGTPEPFYGVCCKNGKYTSGGIEPTRIYLPEYIDSRTPIYHSGDIFSSISPMILQESSLTVSKGLNADHTPLSLTSSTLKLNSIDGNGMTIKGVQSTVELGDASLTGNAGLVFSGATVLDFDRTALNVHGCTLIKNGTLVVKNKIKFEDVNGSKGFELWKTDCFEGNFTSVQVAGFSAAENACLTARYAQSTRFFFLICANEFDTVGEGETQVPVATIVSVVVIVVVFAIIAAIVFGVPSVRAKVFPFAKRVFYTKSESYSTHGHGSASPTDRSSVREIL